MEYLRIILNNALYFSLLLIILSSVISVFFVGRKRDRCLRDFNGYFCSVFLKSGKEVYGRLRVFGTGIEYEYRDDHHDTQGHLESSFIIYASEFGDMLFLKRFHRKLSAENMKKRFKSVRAVYKPSIFRIVRRKFRNFLSTFQDGITRSLNTVIGMTASRNPKSHLSERQKEISGLGTQVVSVVSHSYDPILERYIGYFVVLETVEQSRITEYCGILKDYTQHFIEILNVLEIENVTFQIPAGFSGEISGVTLAWTGPVLSIKNNCDWPVYLRSVSYKSTVLVFDQLIPETSVFPVDMPGSMDANDEIPNLIEVEVSIPNIFDMVVPRPFGLIRHGCPRDHHSLETFIGTSGSKTLQNALHSQFVMLLNAQKPVNPEETAYQG
jgi:hypothetical protein